MNEMGGKNETLYLVYIWFTFEGDLNGVLREIALHGGVECYIEGCWVGCVGWLMCCMGHFVGFWARMAAHVDALSS